MTTLIEPTIDPNLTSSSSWPRSSRWGPSSCWTGASSGSCSACSSSATACRSSTWSWQAGGASAVRRRQRAREMSDPLPQAMVLTAIVISLATMGFLLALAYRLWQVAGTDDVPDDAEDARILDLALANETSSTYDPNVTPTTTADESAREENSP